MPVKERIKEFIKTQHISERQFCLKIGVSPAYISSMRMSIQPDKLASIAKHFPELNTGWLMTGEGEMIKKEYKTNQEKSTIAETAIHYDKLAIESLNNAISILGDVVDKYYRENEDLKEKLKTANVEIDKLKKHVDVEGVGVDDVAKNCG